MLTEKVEEGPDQMVMGLAMGPQRHRSVVLAGSSPTVMSVISCLNVNLLQNYTGTIDRKLHQLQGTTTNCTTYKWMVNCHT